VLQQRARSAAQLAALRCHLRHAAPLHTRTPRTTDTRTHTSQLVDLFRSYFEGALNENSVKRNFVLIYELLDETMDFGFPQLTGASRGVWRPRHGGRAVRF
jgi:hypothetical protein